ncbi:MAG: polyribonucleotide nucleotidyltransferase [Puniceicoccales bacterium]|jgi:polyribonucleotide nucleotidyltransferase|nr:polyribonucleotide nucleotidyltransferase [Puniceicoccales bacterium]
MEEDKQRVASVQTHLETAEGLGIDISTGNLAGQANGAVTVQLGETVVFVAVTAAEKVSSEQDYFPLGVEYREKFCAAGRFPGGYVRREGRPSEKEILTARLCDRPLRPLFPRGFRNEVQVVGMVLAADLGNEPDVLMVNGASAALLCSDIPWNGPIGCVRIGEVKGEFVINPTNGELFESNLDLLYVGNERDMLMIEGSADQISESRFLEALTFAQEQIQSVIAAQRRLAAKAGKAKRTFPLFAVPQDILAHCAMVYGQDLAAAVALATKPTREAAIREIQGKALVSVREKFGESVQSHAVAMAFEELQENLYRKAILEGKQRVDGRSAEDLRAITCAAGFLPRVHGVSLFQRGETQAMVSVTLGTGRDAQALEGITGGVNEKSFILHYNFPPFSVGETGRFGSPGRREVGHGALAERALLPVIPDAETFPYSLRVVSEVLESNGSSSMATVCGGSLALMDAGVPLLAPVSGISTGLITERDSEGNITKYVVLTDILGSEDHYGDMDFKIAGTNEGITGFQLDLKIAGLPFAIAEEAVRCNTRARSHIAKIMEETLAEPRTDLKPWAPRMRQIQIPADKIGALIGPGGKNIRRIAEETGAKIDVDSNNSGRVMVFASSAAALDAAIREIGLMNCEIEVGKTYRGVVRGIKEFGVFVECLPGKEGLVHISELDEGRVENAEDICRIGDEMVVRCIGSDERGRVKLSRRAALCDARGVPYEPARAPAFRPSGGGFGGPRRDFPSGGDRGRGGPPRGRPGENRPFGGGDRRGGGRDSGGGARRGGSDRGWQRGGRDY